MRKFTLFALVLLLSIPAFSSKKKKQVLPDAVLNAQTVQVEVDPDAGDSLTNPGEQGRARTAVEHALDKWGRFRIEHNTAEVNAPDLIIEIRKGIGNRLAVHGLPSDRDDTTIDATQRSKTIAVGTPARKSQPTVGPEYSTASEEDLFTVYLGSENTRTIVWRYSGKDALAEPAVRAVIEFQKAMTQSEEARSENKKKQ